MPYSMQHGWAALWLMSAAAPAMAQPTPLPPDLGVRWAVSEAVPARQITGVVVDVDTGVGLESAQVHLVGTQVGALTNREGRFRLDAPRDGEFQIRVELIGYRSMTSILELEPGAGIAAVVSTEFHPLTMCGLMVCAYPGCESGVRVEVRALDTGLAPEGEVVLTVRTGELTDLARGVAPARDSLYLERHSTAPEFQEAVDSAVALMPVRLLAGGHLDTYGPFEVHVSTPSYEPWTASDVWLVDRECLPRVSPVLRVWLLPRYP